ncbi:MAG: hypothetical protein JW730_18660 [Anaerolineales bacterium]|nr:hypothetical protein [Anaerolineales bacterium]
MRVKQGFFWDSIPTKLLILLKVQLGSQKKYGTNVLLSLGAEGAVVAKGQETFLVKNPTVEAKSAVGSGDCTLAGLTYGVLQGLSFQQAVICWFSLLLKFAVGGLVEQTFGYDVLQDLLQDRRIFYLLITRQQDHF